MGLPPTGPRSPVTCYNVALLPVTTMMTHLTTVTPYQSTTRSPQTTVTVYKPTLTLSLALSTTTLPHLNLITMMTSYEDNFRPYPSYDKVKTCAAI